MKNRYLFGIKALGSDEVKEVEIHSFGLRGAWSELLLTEWGKVGEFQNITLLEGSKLPDSYKVINYFDVWGNEEDGYEVNNMCSEGVISLEDYTSKAEIIQALVDKNLIVKNADPSKIEIVNDYEMIELFHNDEERTMYPLFRLELIQ